ncbi:hypothetical protein [Streptomyces sp. NPDC050504]|uniref:hypothetical protein n=1 Tax=Streptomyces sp. NPDC050504 TaxID=3365618 RepID=UPI0037ADA8D1
MPWSTLTHAYGNAADVPGALRALAHPEGATDEELAEILGELDMAIYHQGGCVYSAGAAAVPFLIELAAAPGTAHRADLAEIIGQFACLHNEMAEPWRSDGNARACRAALVAGHDTLLALVADEDPAVRAQAGGFLWDYARWAPRADEAVAALVARDADEDDLALRTALRAQGARTAVEARDAGAASAPVLLAGVRALLDATGPALEFARLGALRLIDPEAAPWCALLGVALAPVTPRAAYRAWREDGARLGTELAALCGDDDPEAQYGIVRVLLADHRAPLRTGALRAAGDVLLHRRSAAHVLGPLLVAALDDPEPVHRAMAADLLAAVNWTGPDGDSAFADRLAVLLGEGGDRAAQAAWALARRGDSRAVPLLLRALGEGECATGFGPSSYYGGSFYWFQPPPLREALVACAAHHPAPLVPALRAALATAADLPRVHLLCEALAACGPAAADALPELTPLLATAHRRPALDVIEALGPAAASCAPALDAAYDALVAEGDRLGALAAARARCAVTGEAAPLLAAVDAVPLPEPGARPAGSAPARPGASTVFGAVAAALAPLGPEAADRVAACADWLRAHEEWWPTHEAIAVAAAHRRVTGDADLARRVVARVLERGAAHSYSPVQLAALRLAVALGEDARPLAPLLRACAEADVRLTGGGGWRGIAEDEEARRLAAAALAALAG